MPTRLPLVVERALASPRSYGGGSGNALVEQGTYERLSSFAMHRAGLRRGHAVLTINGQPAAQRRRFDAFALLVHRVDVVNTLTTRTVMGATAVVELGSESLPMLLAGLLPGPIGLLRWNAGGVSVGASRLFVAHGRLFRRQRHNAAHLPDGTVLAMREDIEADGTALPFQRRLVGPGGMSGAESFAGPLQAHGRALLVGERTAGLCGGMRFVELAPGWRLAVTYFRTLVGPQERALNRVGVTPDLVVTPSPADETAARDPQLETALDLLRRRTTAY